MQAVAVAVQHRLVEHQALVVLAAAVQADQHLDLVLLTLVAVVVVLVEQQQMVLALMAVLELLFFLIQHLMVWLLLQQARQHKHLRVAIISTSLQEAGASLSNGTLCAT
jgi:hypothetical protein